MIIKLKKEIQTAKAEELAVTAKAFCIKDDGAYVLVNSSEIKKLPDGLESFTDTFFASGDDIQLGKKEYKPLRKIDLKNASFGGKTHNTLMITGPCSVESEEQIFQVAELLNELNIYTIRGGCYKPRTSPYTFQGLGLEGLKLLAKVREKYGFNVITEVRDSTHLDEVIEYSDIIQVGAKAMYDYGILTKCGKQNKPVLLKRGFGTTLKEFLQMAEYILSGGNPNVILCERGIRTFETATRFTLDLCGVAYIKEKSNLPVILDPSHAIGYSYGVPDLARACVAMGVDGLLIETHPNPPAAKSDAAQQLNFDQFREMHKTLVPIAAAIGRKMI